MRNDPMMLQSSRASQATAEPCDSLIRFSFPLVVSFSALPDFAELVRGASRSRIRASPVKPAVRFRNIVFASLPCYWGVGLVFCRPIPARKPAIWLSFWRLEAWIFSSLRLYLRLFTSAADIGLHAMEGHGFTSTI